MCSCDDLLDELVQERTIKGELWLVCIAKVCRSKILRLDAHSYKENVCAVVLLKIT